MSVKTFLYICELKRTKYFRQKNQQSKNQRVMKKAVQLTEKRFNEVKVGEVFKRSESYSGTVTFKKVGVLQQLRTNRNEYFMECVVVDCSKKDSYFFGLIGQKTFVSSVMRYGKLGKVKVVDFYNENKDLFIK